MPDARTRRSVAARAMGPGLLFLLVVTWGSSTLAAPPSGWIPGLTDAALLGKSWALGYAITFLAIFLGALPVAIPSMRKKLPKRKD